ncbi:hypothetical protein [Micromonospora deserti]|uniref:Uncharacterized protein n=1 Tax=Micromonospora deserti TaxID=2070366 RepID=A0A2W2DYD7_9ACTN|nr:hypothetical protein [Micromonospora deserti]PZG02227.1 hypothetical protein C1I99_03755 [Micromonospora deserti]
MAQTLQLRAPSGNRVRVSLPDSPTVSAIGTHSRFFGPNFSQAIQTGGRGYHAEVCELVVPATVKDRFLYQGREVAVAVSDDGHDTVAGWIGPHHEAVIFFTGPVGGRAAILKAFEYFVFDDAPEGLKIQPVRLTGVELESDSICVLVDRNRRVVIPSLESARTMVPSQRGAQAQHGEVWRISKHPEGLAKDREGVRDSLFLLGTQRGLAEVSFEESVTGDDDALLSWLEALDVSWE